MSSRRTEKAAQAILESVSSTILFGLKDPRVKNVTVVNVEVGGDLRTAKVYVSVMGDERVQSLCMHGLNSARGFLQSKVADRLQTRYTPVLKFILDPSVKRSAETSRLLRESGSNDSDDVEGDDDNVEDDGKDVSEDVSEAALFDNDQDVPHDSNELLL